MLLSRVVAHPSPAALVFVPFGLYLFKFEFEFEFWLLEVSRVKFPVRFPFCFHGAGLKREHRSEVCISSSLEDIPLGRLRRLARELGKSPANFNNRLRAHPLSAANCILCDVCLLTVNN